MLLGSRFSVIRFYFALTLTGLITHAVTCRSEVTSFQLNKAQYFLQTSNTPPTAAASYGVQGNVYFSDPDDLTTAVAVAPPGVALLTKFNAPTVYQPNYSVSTSVGYGTLASLDAAIPLNTTGTLTISGGTLGMLSTTITTPPVNLFSADIPFFADNTYDLLQAMNPHESFAVETSEFQVPIGANESQIYVGILRRSNKEVVFWSSGDNADTVTNIPSNTLQPNTTYEILMGYRSGLSTPNAEFNGAPALFSFSNETRIIFSTSVPEASTLMLVIIGAIAFGTYTLRPMSKR